MEKFTPGDVVNLVRSNGIQLLVTVTKKNLLEKREVYGPKFFFFQILFCLRVE